MNGTIAIFNTLQCDNTGIHICQTPAGVDAHRVMGKALMGS